MAEFTQSGFKSGISASKMTTAEPKKAVAQKVGGVLPSTKKAQPTSSMFAGIQPLRPAGKGAGVQPTKVAGAGKGVKPTKAEGKAVLLQEPKKQFYTKFGEGLGKAPVSQAIITKKEEDKGYLSLAEYVSEPSKAFARQREIQKKPVWEQAYEFGMGAVESVAEIPSYFVIGAEKVGITSAIERVAKTEAGGRFVAYRTAFKGEYGQYIAPKEIKQFSMPSTELLAYSLGATEKRRAKTEEVALMYGGGAVLGAVGAGVSAYAPATLKAGRLIIPTSKVMQATMGATTLGLTGLYGAGRYAELTKGGKTPVEAISRIGGEFIVAGAMFQAGAGLGKAVISPIAKPMAFKGITKGKYTPMEYAQRPFAYQKGEWGAKYSYKDIEAYTKEGIKYTTEKSFTEGTLKEYTKSIDLTTKELVQVSTKRTPYGTITGEYRQFGTFERPVEPYKTFVKTGLETYPIATKRGLEYGIRPTYELKTISTKTTPISTLELRAVSPKAVSFYARTITPEGIKTAYITSGFKYKLPFGYKIGAVSKAEVSTTIPKDYFTVSTIEGLGVRATGFYAEAGAKGRLQYIKGAGGERYVSFEPSRIYGAKTKLITGIRGTETYQALKLYAPKVKGVVAGAITKTAFKITPKTFEYRPTGISKAISPLKAIKPAGYEAVSYKTGEVQLQKISGIQAVKQYQATIPKTQRIQLTALYPAEVGAILYQRPKEKQRTYVPQAFRMAKAVIPAVAQKEALKPLTFEGLKPYTLEAPALMETTKLALPQAYAIGEPTIKRELEPPQVPPMVYPTYYTPPEFYAPFGFGISGGLGGYGVGRKIKGHLLSFPKVELKIIKKLKL
jgi:hypothetical protein